MDIAAIVTVLVASCSTPPHAPPATSTGAGAQPVGAATGQVLEAVEAAQHLQHLPPSVQAGLSQNDAAMPHNGQPPGCHAAKNPADAGQFGECDYGDPSGKKTMVIYGDYRANMWASVLQGVAVKSGWKLRIIAKHGCPVPDLQLLDPQTKTRNDTCDQFHSVGPAAVKGLHANLVIVASASTATLAGGAPRPRLNGRPGGSRH